MLEIKQIKYLSYAKTVDDRSRVAAELFADEVSDLPETEGIDGYTLSIGSIAYVITTGELYVLGSDGQWYANQSSSAADVQTISGAEENSDELMGNSENV